MGNSPLVCYTSLSPHRSSPRAMPLDTLTIHCVVGQCTVSSLGKTFLGKRKASSNYGVDRDGKIGLYVPEGDRSWCSSDAENDHRAVTIEVASDNTHPYTVNPAAYAALLDLVTDICQRNGIHTLLWLGDREETLKYQPKPGEMRMTVHRWFAKKACPGQYLYERMGHIAQVVTDRLKAQHQEVKDLTPEQVRQLVREELAQQQLARSAAAASSWAQEQQIQQRAQTLGISDGQRPRDYVTREEAMAMCLQVLERQTI